MDFDCVLDANLVCVNCGLACKGCKPTSRRFCAAATKPASFVSALDVLPCAHRGAALRAEPNDLCGCEDRQETIYACAVHVECSATRFADAPRRQPAVCLTCRHRSER